MNSKEKYNIRVPGSKSISNRAILLASLAGGVSNLQNILHSDDTQYMIGACRQLGVCITEVSDKSLRIEGLGGHFSESSQDLYIGNAGTCARFLCAALMQGQGSYTLRGNARMHERPMGDLVRVLRTWGAQILCLEKEDCLPLRIIAGKKLEGGNVRIRADKSSQFLSALLMLAPLTEKGAEIEVEGDFVSSSYVTMTASMMRDFGVKVLSEKSGSYSIPASQSYTARDYEIPGDASSASYFFALAALTGKKIRVEGIALPKICAGGPSTELTLSVVEGLGVTEQGDLSFLNLLESMGTHVEYEHNAVTVQGTKLLQGTRVDMNDMSDVVPTLAVLALFANSPTEIYHVAHMREKECDRIHALYCELTKLGAKVTEFADGLRIEPPVKFNTNVEIKCYDDHRIAMAFAILTQKIEGIHLEDPGCVSKTYPGFFEDILLFSNLLESTRRRQDCLRAM